MDTREPTPTPKGFLTFTYNEKPITVALHSIGLIEPSYSPGGKAQSTVVLSFGKDGKSVYGGVKETYEELLMLIAQQQPA